MNQKYVVLFTRNLNSPENYQDAVSTLNSLPGVSEVYKHEDEKDGGSSLSTRLVVGYDSIETSPEMLMSELNSLGYPVVMQEEAGPDVLHIDPSRNAIPNGGYDVGDGHIVTNHEDSGEHRTY